MHLQASRLCSAALKTSGVLGARNWNKFTRTLAMMATQKVTFPSENKAGAGQGVLIGDAAKTPLGLIVIHEWWGLNAQIQEEGEMISRDGNLTVLVPDMYRGKATDDREEAGHLMTGLDWPGALLDISAAAKFLQSKGCAKVGITGFCMGGALSFAAAAKCPEISASAPFYGIPGADLADLTTIKIPVQAHFGEKDDIAGFSSPADFNPLKEKLLAAGVNFEMFTYDAGHAFTNFSSDNYVKEAASKALGRMYEFMQKNLKQGGNL